MEQLALQKNSIFKPASCYLDTILHYLNKGLIAENNLEAIRLIRRPKAEFLHQFGVARKAGANHGLMPHPPTLIIHHAFGVGRWIREIERNFRRAVTFCKFW